MFAHIDCLCNFTYQAAMKCADARCLTARRPIPGPCSREGKGAFTEDGESILNFKQMKQKVFKEMSESKNYKKSFRSLDFKK